MKHHGEKRKFYVFYQRLAYYNCLCYYEKNPADALSGPRSVVPSNDGHISSSLF